MFAEAADSFRSRNETLVKKRFRDRLVRRAILAVLPPGNLIQQETLAGWQEEVEYQGRRLTKLGVTPDAIATLLDESPMRELPGVSSAVWAEFQSTTLTYLFGAMQQVREAEQHLMSVLFQDGLEVDSPAELLQRGLQAILPYAATTEGRAWLRKPGSEPEWQLVAASGHDKTVTQPATQPLRCFSTPRCAQRGESPYRTPDPLWAGQFVTLWSLPVVTGENITGLLECGFHKPYPWLPREKDLLTGAAALTARALQRLSLIEQLRMRESDIRQLLARLVEVEEAERRRIGRDLHDEAGQSMMCLRLQLEMLGRMLPAEAADCREKLATARDFTDRCIGDIRRIISALTPSVLEELGLCAAVRQLVTRFRELHPVTVTADIPERLDLPRKVELVVYRIMQEILNNVGKYSQASRLNLFMVIADEVLRITVKDNGVGFDVDNARARRDCFGLAGIQERIRLMNGRLSVISRQGEQSGTQFHLELPVSPKMHISETAQRLAADPKDGQSRPNPVCVSSPEEVIA